MTRIIPILLSLLLLIVCAPAQQHAIGSQALTVGERRYPDDYPAVYGELTVTGVFGTYEESGYTYLQLIDAVMSF